jgi:hypothetical protein
MRTFVKVLLVVLAAIVALRLLPLLMASFALSGAGLLLGGILLTGGIAAALGVGFVVLIALLVVALVVAAALSPIWIPVLLVVGLIALIRRCSRARA